MKNIILFGPPGAGKGTQAELVSKKYRLVHISTGDIFREEIKTQTPLGLKIKSIIDLGELVPDEILIEIIQNVYKKYHDAKGILLDGFPRTIAQAVALDELMKTENSTISKVISLHVEPDELLRRLSKRSELSNRTDDNVEVIKHRLDVYKKQTLPLEDFYVKQNKFITIEGLGTIEDIFSALCVIVESI